MEKVLRSGHSCRAYILPLPSFKWAGKRTHSNMAAKSLGEIAGMGELANPFISRVTIYSILDLSAQVAMREGTSKNVINGHIKIPRRQSLSRGSFTVLSFGRKLIDSSNTSAASIKLPGCRLSCSALRMRSSGSWSINQRYHRGRHVLG